MSLPVVVAIGGVDRERIAGTGGVATTWSALDAPAPGTGRTFKALLGRSDETFRRLDHLSRLVVLAGEAAGLQRVIPAEWRDDTALLFESTLGCLDADLRFARSLEAGLPEGPIFPYTLPSTCLGELALRHGLRGVSNCLPILPAEAGAALAEAARGFTTGEWRCAVVASVDVLTVGRPSVEPVLAVSLAVLAAASAGLPAVAPWPGCGPDAWPRLWAAVPR